MIKKKIVYSRIFYVINRSRNLYLSIIVSPQPLLCCFCLRRNARRFISVRALNNCVQYILTSFPTISRRRKLHLLASDGFAKNENSVCTCGCVRRFFHLRVAERIRNVTILLNLVPSFSVRDQSSVRIRNIQEKNENFYCTRLLCNKQNFDI